MVNQTSHVHADAEGNDVQIEVDAARIAKPHIKHRHSGVEPEIEPMVAGEVSATSGLLI
jgi:hypothetical protein